MGSENHSVGSGTRAAVGVLCCAACAAPAIAQALPDGIHHYELIILTGDDVQSSALNEAFEVTDCGRVVGRVAKSGVVRAFAWHASGFGVIPANRLTTLEGAEDGSSEAFDATNSGVVVGILGNSLGLVGPASMTGCHWTLSTSLDSTPIAPPSGWPVGADSMLHAISAAPPYHAAGWAVTAIDCFQDSDRKGAFRLKLDGQSFETIESEAAQAVAQGISANSLLMVGSAPQCGTEGIFCHTNCPATLMRPSENGWTLEERAPPSTTGSLLFTSELRGVTDDGMAVGTRLDSPSADPCDQYPVALRAIELGTSSIDLPFLRSTIAGIADDLEISATDAGHFACGMLASTDGHQFGVIWYRTNGPSWTRESWQVYAAQEFVSPLNGVSILRLRGVNRYGDVAGTAVLADGTTIVPVYLRAVRCSGDLDHSGVIDAPDLSLLLGAWGCGQPCRTRADLNLDGAINAADLSFLLAAWGEIGCGERGDGTDPEPVPEEIAADTKARVELSISYAGLSDLPTYREWAATAPAFFREIMDEYIWQLSQVGE